MSEINEELLEQVWVPDASDESKQRLAGLAMGQQWLEADSRGRERRPGYAEFYMMLADSAVYHGVTQLLQRGVKVPLFRYVLAPVGMTRIISTPYYNRDYRRRHLVIEEANPDDGRPTVCHLLLEDTAKKEVTYQRATNLRQELQINTKRGELDFSPETGTTVTTLESIPIGGGISLQKIEMNADVTAEYRKIMNTVHQKTSRQGGN